MALPEILNYDYHFRWQYDWAKTMLSDASKFNPEYVSILIDIQKLMSESGFEPAHAGVLDRLRAKIAAGCKGQTVTDAGQSILYAVGIPLDDGKKGPIEHVAKMAASALKLLQHVYMIEHAGNRHVCICSLPKSFYHWPSLQMHETVTTKSGAHRLLNSQREQFTALQKKQLVGACTRALAWAQRTNMVLALAASKDSANATQREEMQKIVRCWFADPSTTQKDLEKYIGILRRGFKAITARLTCGKFVLVDWVPLRRAASDAEQAQLKAAAFVLPEQRDSLDVIYIESGFFDTVGDVLQGPKFWSRVILHELSHLICKTDDIATGKIKRYAKTGIGPHAGFLASEAIKNADNWAMFSIDCAMALTESERRHALRKI